MTSSRAPSSADAKQVEAKVLDYWKDANVQSVSATKEFEFGNGFIWSVTIKDENGKNRPPNYCYACGDNIDRFDSLDELTRFLGRKRSMSSLIYSILDVGGISGMIAILIAITLCLMALFN